MNRRMVVESANAALKGGFVDVSRGFMRVFGLTKISVLFGFTLAAYNVDRVKSFEAKRAEIARTHPTRAKRRLGTWRHLQAHAASPTARGTSPPG